MLIIRDQHAMSRFDISPIPRLAHSMVITMNDWITKYRNRDEFLTWFMDEQEYVDAMFIQMIMFNFGVWLDMEELA